jgi:hypothetical protein
MSAPIIGTRVPLVLCIFGTTNGGAINSSALHYYYFIIILIIIVLLLYYYCYRGTRVRTRVPWYDQMVLPYLYVRTYLDIRVLIPLVWTYSSTTGWCIASGTHQLRAARQLHARTHARFAGPVSCCGFFAVVSRTMRLTHPTQAVGWSGARWLFAAPSSPLFRSCPPGNAAQLAWWAHRR